MVTLPLLVCIVVKEWLARLPTRNLLLRGNLPRDQLLQKANYFLEKPPKDVGNFKDLGATITRDLSWGYHISYTMDKAKKVQGSIKRSVGTANSNIFSMLYKSLVRPILEYTAPVWCPYLVKDINALANVQRRASRLALIL